MKLKLDDQVLFAKQLYMPVNPGPAKRRPGHEVKREHYTGRR